MNSTDKSTIHRLDISQITSYLFISALPRKEHANQLCALGIRLILNMHWMMPPNALKQPPLDLVWLPTFDLSWLKMPIYRLHQGVDAALLVINQGDNVLVHCKAGVHRSVAMASCILIAMGLNSDQAMQLIKEKRSVADPEIWYIQERIRKFEVEYQNKQKT